MYLYKKRNQPQSGQFSTAISIKTQKIRIKNNIEENNNNNKNNNNKKKLSRISLPTQPTFPYYFSHAVYLFSTH